MSNRKHDDDNDDPSFNEGRRRLLRMAVYVPPVVIGAITLSQAGCQPEPCPSCVPLGGTGICPPGLKTPSSSPPADKAAPQEEFEPGES
ncbi:MAG: hypothetical protein JNL83_06635 [Myxococcales bacterium]|nr:hypothetical protein [Myxococcales bacterium]